MPYTIKANLKNHAKIVFQNLQGFLLALYVLQIIAITMHEWGSDRAFFTFLALKNGLQVWKATKLSYKGDRFYPLPSQFTTVVWNPISWYLGSSPTKMNFECLKNSIQLTFRNFPRLLKWVFFDKFRIFWDFWAKAS